MKINTKKGILLFIILLSLTFPLHATNSTLNVESALIELDDDTSDFLLSLAKQVATEYNVSVDQALGLINAEDEQDAIQDRNSKNETVVVAEEYEEEVNLNGELVVLEESDAGLTGMYLELGEVQQDNIEVTIEPLKQGEIVINNPIQWTQVIHLRNNEDVEKEFQLNLNSYDEINNNFLQETTQIQISDNSEVISEVAIAMLTLEANEERTLEVAYQTNGLAMEKECTGVTLADILPKDAIIIESEFPEDAIIARNCKVNIFYESTVYTENLEVYIPDFMNEDISKVWINNKNVVLEVKDGIVTIPQ